jgi:hypothetical protein
LGEFRLFLKKEKMIVVGNGKILRADFIAFGVRKIKTIMILAY